MNDLVAGILLLVAVVANGLLAGLFFVFTNTICPAFAQLDDGGYVRAFRQVNRTIVNGWFLSIFFAAPGSAVAVTALDAWRTGAPSTALTVGALGAVATFVITTAANVPLNRQLDEAPVDTDHQRAAARHSFEKPWNRWNLVRALTAATALGALSLASVT